MKIQEVIDVSYGQKDFAEVLAKAGYKEISNDKGHFSKVYHKEGDPFALKIFFDWDIAYKKFIQFAMNNQDSPHMPRFKSKMVRLNYNHCAVRVELLKPWDFSTDPMLVEALHILSDPEIQEYKNNLPDNEPDFSNIFMERYNAAEKHMVENYPPSLMEIIERMKKGLFLNHLVSDIKSDNIMLRGSTIVLIDPVR
jgi:hypothetical protein